MASTRNKTKAVHYGVDQKLCQLNKAYKNQPTVSPKQVGPNIYRFSNKKFANKEMMPTSNKKKFQANQKEKNKNNKQRPTITQYKSQSILTQILQSKCYQELYKKYTQTKKSHQKQKKQIQKDIKQLDERLNNQEGKYNGLISRMTQIQIEVQQLRQEYYEIRRKNLDLNCQLDVLRGNQYQNQQNSQGYEDQDSFQIDIDQMDYEQILLLQERMGSANVGLSTQNISKLVQKPFKQYKLDKQNSFLNLNPEEQEQISCCICCQNIQQEQIITKLSCNHVHHYECLSKWLKLKRFCPLCKGQITVQK